MQSRLMSLKAAFAGIFVWTATLAHAQALCPGGPCAYISGTESNSLYVFDTVSQTIVNTVTNLFPGPLTSVMTTPLHVAVAPTPNGDMVYVGMYNATSPNVALYNLIAVVNAATGVKNFITTDGSVGDFTVSSDGSRVFAVERCPTGVCVLIIDTAAPTSVLRIPTDISSNGFPVGFGVALIPGDNREFYISSPQQGIIEHYDLSGTGSPIDNIDVSAYNIFHYGVAIAPGATKMYVRTSLSNIIVVDLTTRKPTKEIACTDAVPPDLTASFRLVLSADGQLLFTDDAEGNAIHVFSTVQEKELGTLKLPATIYTGTLGFTLDGGFVWALSEFFDANTPFALYRFDLQSIAPGPNSPTVTLSSFLPPTACGANYPDCWIAMAPGMPPAGANGVSITPVSLALHANQTGQLTVAPLQTGDTVQWSASPSGVVTLTPLGASATIAAPSPLTAQQAVTISATVTNQTLGIRTATATVTLLPAVSILVWPAPYASPLTLGQTDKFYATAISSVNPNLTWSLSPPNAPATLTVPFASIGVTDEAHLTYTGPPASAASNIHVIATAVEDPTVSYSYPVSLCGFSLSATSASATAAGLSSSVTVTDPSSCNWTAFSNASWLHLTSATVSGNSTQLLNFTVDANPGPTARTGTMTLAGITFTVQQSVAVLSIMKSHTGSFIQGQTGATYTIKVSNAPGASVTNGPVTVTEAVPSGLKLVSMNGGPSWGCSAGTCTQNNLLAAGDSYQSITVTVNVDRTAPSSVTNQATVSGGSSASAAATDVTAIAGLCDVQQTGNIGVVGVQIVIQQALGQLPAANFLAGNGTVGTPDVRKEVGAALGQGCPAI